MLQRSDDLNPPSPALESAVAPFSSTKCCSLKGKRQQTTVCGCKKLHGCRRNCAFSHLHSTYHQSLASSLMGVVGSSLSFSHCFNDAGIDIGGIDCPLDKAILVCALDNAVLEDKAVKATETTHAGLLSPRTNTLGSSGYTKACRNVFQVKALGKTPCCRSAAVLGLWCPIPNPSRMTEPGSGAEASPGQVPCQLIQEPGMLLSLLHNRDLTAGWGELLDSLCQRQLCPIQKGCQLLICLQGHVSPPMVAPLCSAHVKASASLTSFALSIFCRKLETLARALSAILRVSCTSPYCFWSSRLFC